MRLAKTVTQPETESELGDDASCQIGATVDGAPVSFDPHAAVRAGKSPLFAILGQADLRARLSFRICLYKKTTKIRDILIYLISFLFPPFLHCADPSAHAVSRVQRTRAGAR